MENIPAPIQVTPGKTTHLFIGWSVVIFGSLGLVFWTIASLNYFGIIALKDWIPGLKFLPRRTAYEYIETLLSVTPEPRYKILCPLAPQAGGEFCKNGKEVFKNNQYVGWGGGVTPSSELRAVLTGKVMPTSITLENGEKFSIVYVYSSERIARYIFKGELIKGGDVGKGDMIAKISGEGISTYENLPFIFSYAREYDQEELLKQEFPIENAGWLRLHSPDFVIDKLDGKTLY